MRGEQRHGRFGAPVSMATGFVEESFSRESGQQRDVLTFSVGGEEYALGIDCIREIIKNRPITEVPRVPAFVAGIIAVRGVVMPVIDLRLRLRLLAAPLSQKARILVVTRPDLVEGQLDSVREPFGLIVDRVHQVVSLWEHDIEPPTMLGGHESDFVSGIGRIHGGESLEPRQPGGPGLLLARPRHMLILLDLPRVLTFEHAGSVSHNEETRPLGTGLSANRGTASSSSLGLGLGLGLGSFGGGAPGREKGP